MQLGYKINGFAGRRDSLAYGVRAVAEAGFNGIGLVFDQPWFWLRDLAPSRVKAIRRMLADAGLTVLSVSSCTASGYPGYGRSADDFSPPGQRFGPAFTSPDPAERKQRVQHTKDVIDFAVQLGCQNVDTSTGYWPKGMPYATAWQYTRDCLEDIADYAEKKEVSLNIEYEPGEFGPGGLFVGDVHTFLAMAADIGSPVVRATYDYIHSWTAGEDLLVTQQLLLDASRLGVVELDDGKKELDPATGRMKRRHFHLVPGDGEIDIGSALEVLRDNDFTGPIIVEEYSQWDNNPDDACRRTYEYLMGNFGEYFE